MALALKLEAVMLPPRMRCPDPPGPLRALLNNLRVETLPDRIPGVGVEDAPWLNPFAHVVRPGPVDRPGPRFEGMGRAPRKRTRLEATVPLPGPGVRPTVLDDVSPTLLYDPRLFDR